MSQGPTTLVMAPTRELATQIQVECDKFGRTSGMRSVCLYGGAPKGGQLSELRRGVYIIICTPGRLNDFLEVRTEPQPLAVSDAIRHSSTQALPLPPHL